MLENKRTAAGRKSRESLPGDSDLSFMGKQGASREERSGGEGTDSGGN